MSAAETDLRTIAAMSPVFQMIGGVDTPDGAVCGIDGVCVVPGESSTAEVASAVSPSAEALSAEAPSAPEADSAAETPSSTGSGTSSTSSTTK
ncbi:MAG: hypothetical protein JWQ64_303 [Subtercola sp.]|nr:hypothetical protein [Subtercola sp.]